MAVDKLVDSTQLDSDLDNIADAILAKSGGSGPLAFPAGFISEIGDIPSGSGGTLVDALRTALEEIGFVTSEFTVTSPSSGNYITVPHTLGRVPTEIIAFAKTPAFVNTHYMYGCCSTPGVDADTNRTYMATGQFGQTLLNTIMMENENNYLPLGASRTLWNFCNGATASAVQFRNQAGSAYTAMYGSTWVLALRDSSGV